MSKRKRSSTTKDLAVHVDVAKPFALEGVATRAVILGGQVSFRGGPVSSAIVLGGRDQSPALLETRSAAGAAVFDGCIYVVGGVGPGPTPANRKTSVETLPISDALMAQKAPSLGTPRMAPGVAVAGSALWAVGGCNGKRVLKTTEYLQKGAASWSPGPDLPVHGRFGSATASISPTLLVSCGGRAGGDSMLCTADMLEVEVPRRAGDKLVASWRPMAPMSVARAGAAAASPRAGPWAGLLLVTGGQTGSGGKVTGSCEFYFSTTNSWSPAPSLRTPRYGHSMWTEPDGSFVVAGGRDASGKYLASCERLFSKTGSEKAEMMASEHWEPWVDLPECRFRAVAVAL